MTDTPVKLTAYSHGAGCGCKISPEVLSSIIKSDLNIAPDPNLLVGNGSLDDAAAYATGAMGPDGEEDVILSTTDFFMPIVDNPTDFGRIAATNAISDIYAMGGAPMMAIAILGWPVDKLPPDVAQKVVDGGRQACADAGIMLAGGHSIDAPEPIFGLAVTGRVARSQLKQNNTAKAGDKLYLTKSLGIGILTTAEKQGKLKPEHQGLATETMCMLNKVGNALARIDGVNAITDVTGFGLAGHLLEVAEGSKVSAHLKYDAVPRLNHVDDYMAAGAIPGGTHRNFASYGHKISHLTDNQKYLLCDPQTSGGLLVAVEESACSAVEACMRTEGIEPVCIGYLSDQNTGALLNVS